MNDVQSQIGCFNSSSKLGHRLSNRFVFLAVRRATIGTTLAHFHSPIQSRAPHEFYHFCKRGIEPPHLHPFTKYNVDIGGGE